MRTSQIIINNRAKKPETERATKLVSAYKKERTAQEVTEVELSRSKIVMIDEYGNLKKVSILAEH